MSSSPSASVSGTFSVSSSRRPLSSMDSRTLISRSTRSAGRASTLPSSSTKWARPSMTRVASMPPRSISVARMGSRARRSPSISTPTSRSNQPSPESRTATATSSFASTTRVPKSAPISTVQPSLRRAGTSVFRKAAQRSSASLPVSQWTRVPRAFN